MDYRKQALKQLQVANYLLDTSYKMLKEPKTLLIITDHVLDSFMIMITGILEKERAAKLIPPYHDNQESKLLSFKNYVAKKHNLNEYVDLIERIIFFTNERKKTPIEFSRKGSYVVCSDQFSKISTITETDVKQYIKKAKHFIDIVEPLHE